MVKIIKTISQLSLFQSIEIESLIKKFMKSSRNNEQKPVKIKDYYKAYA